MPYTIPEAMPQDWLVPALEAANVSVADDRAALIEEKMRETYAKVLEGAKVAQLNGTLKMACLATAQRYRVLKEV